MNNKPHKLSSLRRKFSAAGLCALAILIMVVSCPIKRVLQNSDFLFTSISTDKNHRIANNHTASAHYTKQLTCLAVQKKTISEAVHLKVKQVLSPFYLAGEDRSSFEIAYFLSRLKQERGFATLFKTSHLSLFLQHRRLLI